MAKNTPDTPLQLALSSLERIQNFDVKQLPRTELGKSFDFKAAVEPAKRLIDLFQKVPTEALSEFPDEQLENIQAQSDAVFNLFDEVSLFDETQQNATDIRTGIVEHIKSHYQSAFNELMQYISYSVARTVDFQRLEIDGRAFLQGIKDQTNNAVEEIETSKLEASNVLDEIKKTAAEQGVSQQAFYFSEEAKEHTTEAKKWKATTRNWAIGIIIYGITSFFFHKIPWIAPTGIAESIIFIASKILIFAILSYMLVLSARNFISHNHNAVVNKHRQNALMTFNALVNASGNNETQDIILNHASSCIFSPQDTGYTKHGGANNSQLPNVIEMIPKTTVRVDG